MHDTLVEPARRWADLTIREGVDDAIALELAVGRIEQLLEVDRAPDPGP